MNTYKIHQEVVLETMECGSCGIAYAAPSSFWAERRKTGGGWYCPNGHERVFRESDVDRLRKQLDQQIRVSSEMTSRATKAEKNFLLLKKRVKAGVCPCCKRTVSQLARHMKSKHPDFCEHHK